MTTRRSSSGFFAASWLNYCSSFKQELPLFHSSSCQCHEMSGFYFSCPSSGVLTQQTRENSRNEALIKREEATDEDGTLQRLPSAWSD